MIAGIASLIFIPLLSVALAHLLWALGNTYPVRTRELLARTVIGTKGEPRMPPRLFTGLFGLLAFAAGIVALSLSDPGAGAGVIAAGVVLALLLCARGIAGYMRFWSDWRPEEPFRSMNRKFYSPLSLTLGVGFLFLVLWRFA